MYAVGLIQSGTVGLLSVSEPGGMFSFSVGSTERNNCKRFN